MVPELVDKGFRAFRVTVFFVGVVLSFFRD
jgi:hypothetical protein